MSHSPYEVASPAFVFSEPDALLEEAERMAAMPRFDRAVREYTNRAMRFRQGDKLINKLISYDKRWRVVGYLLYFALDQERYGAQGGASYGRLHDICTARLQISPRVLKTALALLRLSGAVRVVPSDKDARLKLHQPTARLFDFVDEWLHYAVNTLDILEPQIQRARMLREDPGFPRRFLVSMGRERLEDKPMVNRMPEYIAFVGRRDGASAVLLSIILADMDEAALSSRAELAARFSLSKTQVNAVIAEAETAGFVFMENGTPRPTAHLLASHRRWISIELAGYARHMLPVTGCP